MTEPVPDGPTVTPDAVAGQRAAHRDGRAGLRSRAGGRFLQHGRGDRRTTARIWANIARRTFRTSRRDSGRSFISGPGNLGYPVFDLGFAKIGVYICYDRHFPEGARCLGLNGAEIVFNPSATVAGLSEYLWKLEQPAHAAANGYFIAAINRVGTEAPWNIGEFYGSSYFCNPRGQIYRAGLARQGRSADRRPESGRDCRGAAHLAVLSATAGPICMGSRGDFVTQ